MPETTFDLGAAASPAATFDLGSDTSASPAAPTFDLGGDQSAVDRSAYQGYKQRAAETFETFRKARAAVAQFDSDPVQVLQRSMDWRLGDDPGRWRELEPGYQPVKELLAGAPRRSLTTGLAGTQAFAGHASYESLMADLADAEREHQIRNVVDASYQRAMPRYAGFAAQLQSNQDQSPIMSTDDKRYIAAHSALASVDLPADDPTMVADFLDRMGVDTAGLRASLKTQGIAARTGQATLSILGNTATGLARIGQFVTPDALGGEQLRHAIDTAETAYTQQGEQSNVNPTALHVATAVAQQVPIMVATRGAGGRLLASAQEAAAAARTASLAGDAAHAAALTERAAGLTAQAETVGRAVAAGTGGLQQAGMTEAAVKANGEPNGFAAGLGAGVGATAASYISPQELALVPVKTQAQLANWIKQGASREQALRAALRMGALTAAEMTAMNEIAAESARLAGAPLTGAQTEQATGEMGATGAGIGVAAALIGGARPRLPTSHPMPAAAAAEALAPPAPPAEALPRSELARPTLQAPEIPTQPVLTPPEPVRGRRPAVRAEKGPGEPVELPPAPLPGATFDLTGTLQPPDVPSQAPETEPARPGRVKLPPAPELPAPVEPMPEQPPLQAPEPPPLAPPPLAKGRAAKAPAQPEARPVELPPAPLPGARTDEHGVLVPPELPASASRPAEPEPARPGRVKLPPAPEPAMSAEEARGVEETKPAVSPEAPAANDTQLRQRLFRSQIRETADSTPDAPRYAWGTQRAFSGNEKTRLSRLSSIIRPLGKAPQLPDLFHVDAQGKIVDLPAPHPFLTFQDVLRRLPPEVHAAMQREKLALPPDQRAGFAARKLASMGWTPEHNVLGRVGEKIDANQWAPVMTDPGLAQLESAANRAMVEHPGAYPAVARAKARQDAAAAAQPQPQQTTIPGVEPPRAMRTDAAPSQPLRQLTEQDLAALPDAKPNAFAPGDQQLLAAARDAGVNLKLVDGADAGLHGAYTAADGKRTVYVSANAEPGHVARVLGHELTHAGLGELPVAERQHLLTTVRRLMDPAVYDSLKKQIEARYGTMSDEHLMEEIAAHHADAVFDPEGEVFNRLYVQHPGIVQRVIDKILAFANRIGLRGNDAKLTQLYHDLHARALTMMREQALAHSVGATVPRFMLAEPGPARIRPQDLHDRSLDRQNATVVGRLAGRSNLLSRLTRWWYSRANAPQTIARDNPAARPVHNAELARNGLLHALANRASEHLRPLLDAQGTPAYDAATALLHQYDRQGQDIPPQVLAQAKPEVRQLVETFRKSIDTSLEHKVVGWRLKLNVPSLSKDPFDAAPYEHEVLQFRRDETAAQAALASAVKANTRAPTPTTAASLAIARADMDAVRARRPEIARMETYAHIVTATNDSRLAGYVPHLWTGDYKAVSVTDPTTGGVVERRMVQSEAASKQAIAEFTAQYPEHEVREHHVDSDLWSLDSLHESGTGRSALKNLLDRDPNLVTDLFGAGPNGQAEAQAFLSSLAAPVKARQNTAGYETDLNHIAARHSAAAARFLADAGADSVTNPILDSWNGRQSSGYQAARRALDGELKALEAMRRTGQLPGKQADQAIEGVKQRLRELDTQFAGRPELRAWWQAYRDRVRSGPGGANAAIDMLANKAQMLAANVYIGGNPTTALFNLFQMAQVGLPLGTALAGAKGGAAVLRAHRHILDFAKSVATHVSVLPGTGRPAVSMVTDYAQSVAKTDPALARALHDAVQQSTVFEVPYDREFMAAKQKPGSGVFGSGNSTFEGALWYLFDRSETANRLGGFLAGWHMSENADPGFWKRAEKSGYPGASGDRVEYAKWFTNQVNFIMGEADRAPMIQGAGKILTSLKSYPIHVWQLQKRMAHTADELGGWGTPEGRRMQAARYGMLGMNAATSGLFGAFMPLAIGKALYQLAANATTDDKKNSADLDTQLYRMLGADSKLADLVTRGLLPGSAGARTSFYSGLFPSDFSNLGTVAAPIGALGNLMSAATDTAKAMRTYGGAQRTPDQWVEAGLAPLTVTSIGRQMRDAYRAATEQKGFQTGTGRTLVPESQLTPTDIALIAMGLRSEKLVDAAREDRVRTSIEGDNDQVVRFFKDRFADAIGRGDTKLLQSTREAVQTYNQQNAGHPEAMVLQSLEASVRREVAERRLGSLHPYFTPRTDVPAVRRFETANKP